MPITPFHIGPALMVWWLLKKRINLFAILIGCTIIDLEPLAIMLFGLNLPLHYYFHTLAISTIVLVPFAFILSKAFQTKFGKKLSGHMLFENIGINSVLISLLLGAYSHIILDSFLYNDIRPLFPLEVNPFLGTFGIYSIEIYLLCSLTIGIGIVLLGLELWNKKG